MERTISIMVGKGSLTHNNRKFTAKNVDASRTIQNVNFINDNIKEVYHELFDVAQKEYNDKQKRKDRIIKDYYEKISNGKQEKLFHEIVIQVGNKDDMNCLEDNGQLARKILEEYMQEFQKRNPYLRVFNDVIHMDEETPHAHIDFIPFAITDGKRGMSTRVSLKQALATQGFKGGSKGDTEWKQWVESEKCELAKVMNRYGVKWKQLGTHEEHLSVLDFKKKERTKEVIEIDQKLANSRGSLNVIEKLAEERLDKAENLRDINKKLTKQNIDLEVDNKEKIKVNDSLVSEQNTLVADTEELQKEKIQLLSERDKLLSDKETTQREIIQLSEASRMITDNEKAYDNSPEWQLPEPSGLMSAKTFFEKIKPLFYRLKERIKDLTRQYICLQVKFNKLLEENHNLIRTNDSLKDDVKFGKYEINKLQEKADNFERVKEHYGVKQIEEILRLSKEQERLKREYENKWRR